MLKNEERTNNDVEQIQEFLKHYDINELRKNLQTMMVLNERLQNSLELGQVLDVLVELQKPESLSFKQYLKLYKLYLQDGTEFFESFKEFFDDLWKNWGIVQELAKNNG